MEIKGALVGAGSVLAVLAGGVVAATFASADDATPVVIETPTPTPTLEPTPEPTPEAVVTPEPAPEPVVEEPAPVEPAPAPAPVEPPAEVAPAPAPAAPAQEPLLVEVPGGVLDLSGGDAGGGPIEP